MSIVLNAFLTTWPTAAKKPPAATMEVELAPFLAPPAGVGRSSLSHLCEHNHNMNKRQMKFSLICFFCCIFNFFIKDNIL
jgi:hypothetical protein